MEAWRRAATQEEKMLRIIGEHPASRDGIVCSAVLLGMYSHRVLETGADLSREKETIAKQGMVIYEQVTKMEGVDNFGIIEYGSTAELFESLGDVKQALTFYDKAIALADKAGDKGFLRAGKVSKCVLLIKIGDYEAADVIYQSLGERGKKGVIQLANERKLTVKIQNEHLTQG